MYVVHGTHKIHNGCCVGTEPSAFEGDIAIGITEIPAVLFRLAGKTTFWNPLTRHQKEFIIVPIYKVPGQTVAIIETALFSTTYKFMCSILVWFSFICRRNYCVFEYGFRRNRFTSSQIFSKDMITVQQHIRYLLISRKPVTRFGKKLCIILLLSLVCPRNWLV